MGVQEMSGSVPFWSLVVPLTVVVAVPGNDTGTGTAQVLPVVLTVTEVMDLPSAA